MKGERVAVGILSVAWGLTISPIFAFFGIIRGIDAFLLSWAASFALIAWASRRAIRKALAMVRRRRPEPGATCIVLGVAGAIPGGAALLPATLILGHATPAGWGFQLLPIFMGIGFLIFYFAGMAVAPKG